MADPDDKKSISIEELYPDLSPEDQEEAENSLRQYVNIVWRIYHRHKEAGTLPALMKEVRKHNKQQEKARNKTKKKPKAKAA